MDIDFEERRVALAVRELAEFRLGPPPGGAGRPGRWRAELGQIWHDTLRKRLTAEVAAAAGSQPAGQAPQAAFERTIRGSLTVAGWTFSLQGRIDQTVEDPERILLREVKSVSCTLPLDPAELRTHYAEYFAQGALYLLLAPFNEAWSGKRACAEVVFVEIGSGMVQNVTVEDGDCMAVRARAEALAGFLEQRRNQRLRLSHLEFHPPFPGWRPGQEDTRTRLHLGGPRIRQLLFEAPTGFGKTGMLLEYALTHLKRGHFDRIIYLTGKSTGQIEVVRQLLAMLPDPAVLPTVVLRNRNEHAIASPLHTCDARGRCRLHADEDWARAGLSGHELLAGGPMTVTRARDIGIRNGICPYSVSRACLPFASAWIGDFHYVFAPGSRAVFLDAFGFRPAATLLLIDEAHNLPDRVADACSARLDGTDLIRLGTELSLAGSPPVLTQSILRLADTVAALPRADQMDPADTDAIVAALAPVYRTIAEGLVPFDDLLEASVDQLFELADLHGSLQRHDLKRHFWSPAMGVFTATCLDASPIIGERLQRFGQTILASATLSPAADFAAAVGLPPRDPSFLPASTPWRDAGYSVAIDLRADTRLRARQASMPLTAETVVELAAGATQPVAVFFPSYAYAESVRLALDQQAPWLRVAPPPRTRDLAAQRAALEEALASAEVLLLVLGTGFTEGIDLLGGRVSRAMVVGPALPEVNPPREALRRGLTHCSAAEAFREAYLRPGILRINQALGRLVRAPGQHAKVLLHCRRFAESEVNALLAPEYRGGVAIRESEQLRAWLAG